MNRHRHNAGQRRVSDEELAATELARSKAVRAVERVADLVEHEDARIALKAAEVLLDRAMGKPAAAEPAEPEAPQELAVAIAQLESLPPRVQIAKLRAIADAMEQSEEPPAQVRALPRGKGAARG